MYRYIFDNFAQSQKNIKTLDKVELRITDLRIEGERHKTSISKDVTVITKELLKRDVETLVIVGEDQSFYQAFSAVLKSGKEVVLGYIPLKNSFYSERLGIPLKEKACELISKRNIAHIRACSVNQFFYIFKADFFDSKKSNIGIFNFPLKKAGRDQKLYVRIRYDEYFNIHGEFSQLFLVNSDVVKNISEDIARAHSVLLKGCGGTKLSDKTSIISQKFHIEVEKKQSLILDGVIQIKGEDFIFEALERHITCIVGPDRG